MSEAELTIDDFHEEQAREWAEYNEQQLARSDAEILEPWHTWLADKAQERKARGGQSTETSRVPSNEINEGQPTSEQGSSNNEGGG